jgi:hypothetical protein
VCHYTLLINVSIVFLICPKLPRCFPLFVDILNLPSLKENRTVWKSIPANVNSFGYNTRTRNIIEPFQLMLIASATVQEKEHYRTILANVNSFGYNARKRNIIEPFQLILINSATVQEKGTL